MSNVLCIKTHSHRAEMEAKAKIFFDVRRFLSLPPSLSLGVNRPLNKILPSEESGDGDDVLSSRTREHHLPGSLAHLHPQYLLCSRKHKHVTFIILKLGKILKTATRHSDNVFGQSERSYTQRWQKTWQFICNKETVFCNNLFLATELGRRNGTLYSNTNNSSNYGN